ncbi:MAG: PD40 domain-containing protein [Chloroflexi bacterium]|nr:PD40 domain-containing protein [Chloroflexota bacterium]
MNADASGIVKIGDSYDNYPSWSPDSKTIAFISGRPGNLQVYTVNSDGTHLLALTSLPKFTAVFDPTWSAQYYTSHP